MWIIKQPFGKRVKKFNKRIKILKKIINIHKNRFSIEDFQELKRHFLKIRSIVKDFLVDYKKCNDICEKIEKYGKELEKYSIKEEKINFSDILKEYYKYLISTQNLIEEGFKHIEFILKKRLIIKVQYELEEVEKIVNSLNFFPQFVDENIEKKLEYKLQELEKRTKELEDFSQKMMRPVTKITIVGRLNNGWRLNDIQKVVIALGGRVIPTRGGTHPYRIIFPKTRSIPLAESTPPEELVSEISKITKIKKETLRTYFRRGYV